jgi:predicted  nucleic acid-binding Zn-ribbon protein
MGSKEKDSPGSFSEKDTKTISKSTQGKLSRKRGKLIKTEKQFRETKNSSKKEARKIKKIIKTQKQIAEIEQNVKA